MSEHNKDYETLPPAERLKLEDVVAPIFDAAMGRRLKIARMQRFWDQAELGERLGINYHTVSDLETGKLMVPRAPFSITKLETVLGPTATKFVVMDRFRGSFEIGKVEHKFWCNVRDSRKQRAPGQHWTRKEILEGRAPKGGSFMGIPTDIWATAVKLNNEQKKKSKPIK